MFNQSLKETDSTATSSVVTSAIDQQRSAVVIKPADNKRKPAATATVNQQVTNSANWDYSFNSVHSRLISDLFKTLDNIFQHFQTVTTTTMACNANTSNMSTKSNENNNNKTALNKNNNNNQTDSFQKNRNLSKSNEENENETENSKHTNSASNLKADKQRHFFKKSNTQVQKRNQIQNQSNIKQTNEHMNTQSRPRTQNSFKSSLKKKRMSLSNPVSIAAVAAAAPAYSKVVVDAHSTQTYQDDTSKKKRVLSHSSSEANTTQIVNISNSIKRKNTQMKMFNKTGAAVKQSSIKSISKKAALTPAKCKVNDMNSSCLSMDKLNEPDTSTSLVNVTGATPSPCPSPIPSKKSKIFNPLPFNILSGNVSNAKKLNLINEEKLLIEKNARYSKTTIKSGSAVVVRMSTLSNFGKKIDKQNSISALMINKGNSNQDNVLTKRLNEACIYNDSFKSSIDEECTKYNAVSKINDSVSPVSSKISLFKKSVRV